MKYQLTVALFIILTSYAYASGDFKSTIEQVYELADDGKISSSSGKLASPYSIGKDFVIDRATGRMTGAITNHNPQGQPTVLDMGSSLQAYKAITIYEPNVTVAFLYVKQFTDGAKKPFMFIDSSSVISGKCVDY